MSALPAVVVFDGKPALPQSAPVIVQVYGPPEIGWINLIVKLVPAVAVGRATVQLFDRLMRFILLASKVWELPDIATLFTLSPMFCTNAVVAIWVLLVPVVAVGAVGIPVNAGESSGAAPKLVSAPPAVAEPVPPSLTARGVVRPVRLVISLLAPLLAALRLPRAVTGLLTSVKLLVLTRAPVTWAAV